MNDLQFFNALAALGVKVDLTPVPRYRFVRDAAGPEDRRSDTTELCEVHKPEGGKS